MEGSTCAPVRPLAEFLAKVEDPRRKQGVRHPLSAILSMAVAAMLCGYRTYPAIAEWGRVYGGDLVKALGFTREKTPSASTLFRLLSRLDRGQLEEQLGAWAQQAMGALARPSSEGPGPAEAGAAEAGPAGAKCRDGVSIDGKTLRGSRRQEAPGVHLLSAFSHRLGVTLGQVAVDDKTNEITAVHELLKGLILQGRVVTMDALLTQKEVAKSIRAKGGTT
jgi:hypothetical protein